MVFKLSSGQEKDGRTGARLIAISPKTFGRGIKETKIMKSEQVIIQYKLKKKIKTRYTRKIKGSYPSEMGNIY